jgi:hypothetical protein
MKSNRKSTEEWWHVHIKRYEENAKLAGHTLDSMIRRGEMIGLVYPHRGRRMLSWILREGRLRGAHLYKPQEDDEILHDYMAYSEEPKQLKLF